MTTNNTNPYDYQSVVAIKFLILKGDSVLLVRESPTNEWMPNRLGLPGGKPMLNETISQTIERKIKTEVGVEINIKGLIKIVDIIMLEKTVYHMILLAEYASGAIDASKIEAAEVAWFTPNKLKELDVDDYTEYYNSGLIEQFMDDNLHPVPLDIITEQDNRTGSVAEWMEKGSKS